MRGESQFHGSVVQSRDEGRADSILRHDYFPDRHVVGGRGELPFMELDGFAIPGSGADQLVFAVCAANCKGCGADEVVQCRGFMPCHRCHREDLCRFDGFLVDVAHRYSLLG